MTLRELVPRARTWTIYSPVHDALPTSHGRRRTGSEVQRIAERIHLGWAEWFVEQGGVVIKGLGSCSLSPVQLRAARWNALERCSAADLVNRIPLSSDPTRTLRSWLEEHPMQQFHRLEEMAIRRSRELESLWRDGGSPDRRDTRTVRASDSMGVKTGKVDSCLSWWLNSTCIPFGIDIRLQTAERMEYPLKDTFLSLKIGAHDESAALTQPTTFGGVACKRYR